MSWKGFFEGIQTLFVDYIFAPYDILRELQHSNWFGANIMSWILMAIGFVAMVYWMIQLSKHNANNEEDRSVKAHDFLG